MMLAFSIQYETAVRERGFERELESKAFVRLVVRMTTFLVVLIEKHFG